MSLPKEDYFITNPMLDDALKQVAEKERIIMEYEKKINDAERKYKEANLVIDKAYFYDILLKAIETRPEVREDWVRLVSMIKLFSDENMIKAIEGKPHLPITNFDDENLDYDNLLKTLNKTRVELYEAQQELERIQSEAEDKRFN